MTPEIPQQFQMFFGNNEAGNPILVSSPKEALRKVNGLTDSACSAFDHFSLARCIMTGYTALSNPSPEWQEVGKSVLNTVEHYLDQAGVFTRMLLPPHQGLGDTNESNIQKSQELCAMDTKILADLQRIPLSQQTKKTQHTLNAAVSRFPKSFAYFRDYAQNFSLARDRNSGDSIQGVYSYYPDYIFAQLFEGGSEEKRSWLTQNETFRLGIIGFDDRTQSIARHPDELVERIKQ